MVNPEITASGAKFWRNGLGQYHRENGPAIELRSGDMYWYTNGEVHREDGPAIEWSDGVTKFWYLNGVAYIEEEYKFIQFMKGIKVNG